MPKRGNLALAACEECRRRKVRCDGVRPVCGACSHRDWACTFQSLPGVTRTAALKTELTQLKATNSNLLELYQQLRDGSPSDAWNLVKQIRSGARIDGLPPHPDAGLESVRTRPFRSSSVSDVPELASGQHGWYQTTSMSSASSSLSNLRRALEEDDPGSQQPPEQEQSHLPRAQQQHEGQAPAKLAVRFALTEEPLAIISARSITGSPYALFAGLGVNSLTCVKNNDALLQNSLQANLSTIQEGFEIQQSCMSEIFFCHNKKTFDDLIACLQKDQIEPQTSAVLCELCAVAIVAGQYVQDSIEPGMIDHWYSSSQQRFEDCMEVSPASAIKVAAMLGLYNLLRQSGLAISFFETGLRLSARYLEEHANEVNFAVNLDTLSTVRAQRSLDFCNGWLQATLGYGYEMTRSSDVSYMSEHDLVHNVTATIAILKATTMRMLWACSDVPGLLLSLRDLQEQLGEWYGRLPFEAQLAQLGGDSRTPIKSSIYYVHLLHLGAIMLMFRHCLAGLQFPGDRESLSAEQRSTMNAALNDGLQAAQHSARMTFLIQQVSQSLRHCWTMIYQSYVSGMILIYNATQLRLAGFSEKHCANSFDLASKVVDGLEFCKELDPVARQLTATLSGHYKCLRGADSHSEDADDSLDSEPPQLGDYLFNVSTENEELHDTSCGLFEELCNPYADGETLIRLHENNPDLPSRTNATPRFPWKSRCWQGYAGSRFGEAPIAITPEISNLEDGYFTGRREPSWWLVKRTSAAIPLASPTLEVS